MARKRIIDARQFTWWHRLRRLGRIGFTLAGGLIPAAITLGLYAGVVFVYRYPMTTFIDYAGPMFLTTAPIFLGAAFWTWAHMEGRYHATLAVRCPRCGYSRNGSTAERCPECGHGA